MNLDRNLFQCHLQSILFLQTLNLENMQKKTYNRQNLPLFFQGYEHDD